MGSTWEVDKLKPLKARRPSLLETFQMAEADSQEEVEAPEVEAPEVEVPEAVVTEGVDPTGSPLRANPLMAQEEQEEVPRQVPMDHQQITQMSCPMPGRRISTSRHGTPHIGPFQLRL